MQVLLMDLGGGHEHPGCRAFEGDRERTGFARTEQRLLIQVSSHAGT